MTWLQTHSGKAFDLLNPKASDVDIRDIAHALSNLCRFGGHPNKFYSVAEHSVYVSLMVPRKFALDGLLHDATEAYVVDVPRPLKEMLSGYVAIEHRVAVAIANAFGTCPRPIPCVKDADNRILLTERDQLLGEPPVPWTWADGLEPADQHIHAFDPPTAKSLFLNRFYDIIGDV